MFVFVFFEPDKLFGCIYVYFLNFNNMAYSDPNEMQNENETWLM